MAAPGAMAAVSMGMQGAQGVLGFMGAKAEGKANQQMYQYQAAVAQMNAQVAKQNADYARAVGEVEAQQRGGKTRAQIGGARAAQAGSGLDVNRGTHVKVRESIADVGAHDVEIVRNNAARKAYGHEVEAANATAQGKIYETAGVNAKKAGDIKAWTSLLGSASSVAGKWSSASASGMFGGPASGGTEAHHVMGWGS